jgi:hypothetical protein
MYSLNIFESCNDYTKLSKEVVGMLPVGNTVRAFLFMLVMG